MIQVSNARSWLTDLVGAGPKLNARRASERDHFFRHAIRWSRLLSSSAFSTVSRRRLRSSMVASRATICWLLSWSVCSSASKRPTRSSMAASSDKRRCVRSANESSKASSRSTNSIAVPSTLNVSSATAYDDISGREVPAAKASNRLSARSRISPSNRRLGSLLRPPCNNLSTHPIFTSASIIAFIRNCVGDVLLNSKGISCLINA